ncbi:patatin-like phospholipase family protein [Hwangdonia lutea]|uniref:Patatin-like phospholipase family protein n=1 Tax=Hwangdonia lutea TaxID=3075823 RepID=A0AA97ENK9_9FLAO|nr:patatin-like phospholipase family protein [Hwangdonia sp. SCSIO 19198]WOD43298.1 patatin-like phospholipase family protein [Hwangdonia sp. SCSIO 19198]
MLVFMVNANVFLNKSTGLVLSGGGVKGIAHIGILKALLQRGIYPDSVSGVSAGALVAALYADDKSTDDMLVFFKETPLLKYNFVTINKPGLFDTDKYIPFFQDFFSSNSFEKLNRKLTIVATNMEKGAPKFFNSGNLFKPLLASAALPPVFSPVLIDGSLYADGGIMNNFPIEPLMGDCELIIGSYTTSMKEVTKGQLKSYYQITQRTNLLMLHANAKEKLLIPDLLFNPKGLDRIGVLDKRGIEQAFVLGYDYASKLLDTKIIM